MTVSVRAPGRCVPAGHSWPAIRRRCATAQPMTPVAPMTSTFIDFSSLVMGSDLAQRAAVDAPFGSGYLARQGRDEIRDDLCDVVRLAHPASE
jgi:hypothetical protein